MPRLMYGTRVEVCFPTDDPHLISVLQHYGDRIEAAGARADELRVVEILLAIVADHQAVVHAD